MCPACQRLATRSRQIRPHRRQSRCGPELQRIEGIGQTAIDRFLCERCGTRMQRDVSSAGRRRLWRTA